MEHSSEGGDPDPKKRKHEHFDSSGSGSSVDAKALSNLKQTMPEKFLQIERDLSSELDKINFSPPVSHVYNPLDYAFFVHSQFVIKFCDTERKIMMLGMNPGPRGMVQTGVPFGNVRNVRDWMGINGQVGRPANEHPQRPVQGFAYKHNEVSGERLWGLFKELCGEAHQFFKHTLIYNHCPLAFMNKSGINITPNQLKHEKKKVIAICDDALYKVIHLFQTTVIVAIGRFAEERARCIKKAMDIPDLQIVYIPHPSQRHIKDSEKWKKEVKDSLEKNGLMQYFTRCPEDVKSNKAENKTLSAVCNEYNTAPSFT